MEEKSKSQQGSVVELSLGENHLRIEGSEEFIGNQLETVIDRLDLSHQETRASSQVEDSEKTTQEDDGVRDRELDDFQETESEEDDGATLASDDRLKKVAEEINADYDKLSQHFYVDDDGPGIHDPRNIEPKYALLGFCVIEKVLNGKNTFGNREMKTRLTDDEMVPIDNWGSQFLYNLRRAGVIKNDPNSDKSRNVPFKLKPQGIHEFVEWVNNQNGE